MNLDEGMDVKDTDVTVKVKKKSKSGGFESFGLTRAVYSGIKRKGYRIPTPIQRKAIPVILDGRDVCAMARTGSGKTAAFLLPMFEKLRTHSQTAKGPRALIVAPTRELAVQTVQFIKELARFLDLRTAVLIGGESITRDYEALSSMPDIVVATPGRIVHHMHEIDDFKLTNVEILVLDEADRLFELGLSDQVREIMDSTPESRQTLMFSATMPKLLADFTRAGLRDPTLIRLDAEERLSEDLQLAFFTVKQHEKSAALMYILHEIIPDGEQTMVFVATRHHVEYYCELLRSSGLSVAMAYGSMDQTARKMALESFKARKSMVMVVTDVAARGLDVPLLDNVINVDFPASSKLFIHRVGRVARAGRTGTAYSFVSNEELAFMVELHLFVGRDLTDLGSFPSSTTDTYNELVNGFHKKNTDLDSMLHTVNNAMKAYKKTRANASGESVRRAKAIMASPMPIHPLIAPDPSDTVASDNVRMLEELRSFRPSTSVFAMSGLGKNKQVKADSATRKRKVKVKVRVEEGDDEGDGEQEDRMGVANIDMGMGIDMDMDMIAHKVKSKRKARPLQRDDDVRLSFVPSGSANGMFEERLEASERQRAMRAAGMSEIEQAVVDLVPDDHRDILRKRSAVKKWDRKRKRYVQVDGPSTGGINADGEKSKRRVKNEAGVYVTVDDRKRGHGMYDEWKKRHGGGIGIHRHSQAQSHDSHDSGSGRDRDRGRRDHVLNDPDKRAKRKYNRDQEQGKPGSGDAGGTIELKRPEQIAKERRRKQKTQKLHSRGAAVRRKKKKY